MKTLRQGGEMRTQDLKGLSVPEDATTYPPSECDELVVECSIKVIRPPCHILNNLNSEAGAVACTVGHVMYMIMTTSVDTIVESRDWGNSIVAVSRLKINYVVFLQVFLLAIIHASALYSLLSHFLLLLDSKYQRHSQIIFFLLGPRAATF